jgi:hypothetical protein
LNYLTHRGPVYLPELDFIYLDMSVLRHDDDFYDALADELHLEPARGYRLARQLKKKARRTVLCLDEIEKMNYASFNHATRDELRGLADGIDAQLTLVVASRTPLDELFSDVAGQVSPLYNICRLETMSPLS